MMPVKTKFDLKPGAATREAYGAALAELGKKNRNIVVLDADLALMCALPGFTVLVPSDEFCARALVHRMAEHVGPCYMRTGRPKAPVIYGADDKFEIGHAKVHGSGPNEAAAIIACGMEVAYALQAQAQL